MNHIDLIIAMFAYSQVNILNVLIVILLCRIKNETLLIGTAYILSILQKMDDVMQERIFKGDPHHHATNDVSSNGDVYDCYNGIFTNETFYNNSNNNNIHCQHIDSNVPGTDDAKNRLERARSRYVTVEVPLVLVTLVMSMVLTCRPEYLRERIARDVFHYNESTNHTGSGCDVNVTETDKEIQSMTSTWLLYLGMIQSFPGNYILAL